MSMFSFPADMNANAMMNPMTTMTDWSKATEMQVTPLMVYPLGAAAAATAIGFGMAGQMTGLVMGACQAAIQSQTSSLGSKPDLSWLVPTLAEDLAPEEAEPEQMDGAKAGSSDPKSADIVELKPAAKAAEAALGSEAKTKPAARKSATTKPATAKSTAAKSRSGPENAVTAKAKPATSKRKSPVKADKAAAQEVADKQTAADEKSASVAVVEKIKSDAKTAAAAASEQATAGAASNPANRRPDSALEPEDYRRPAEIEKPGQPDDLKQISGIGPKLEQVLNGLGVWTFDQIADWKAEQIAWVDDYLQFSGRIDRDDWVAQARALARGGITA